MHRGHLHPGGDGRQRVHQHGHGGGDRRQRRPPSFGSGRYHQLQHPLRPAARQWHRNPVVERSWWVHQRGCRSGGGRGRYLHVDRHRGQWLRDQRERRCDHRWHHGQRRCRWRRDQLSATDRPAPGSQPHPERELHLDRPERVHQRRSESGRFRPGQLCADGHRNKHPDGEWSVGLRWDRRGDRDREYRRAGRPSGRWYHHLHHELRDAAGHGQRQLQLDRPGQLQQRRPEPDGVHGGHLHPGGDGRQRLHQHGHGRGAVG